MPARLCKLRFTNLDDYSIFLCIRKNAGPVAQLAEPSAHNRLVPGSSPGRPTSIKKARFWRAFFMAIFGLASAPLKTHRITALRADEQSIVSNQGSVFSSVAHAGTGCDLVAENIVCK